MDLISRQAAIDAVKEYGAAFMMEYSDDMSKEEIAENAIRSAKNTMLWILKELPTAEPERKTGGWSPCSERLPEKYGWYQVTLKDGRVSRLYYDYKSGRWIDNVRKHMFELYDIYSKRTHKRITEEKEDVYWDDWVLAWMPLPESYEG